jgi:hypothetical protein
MRRVIWLQTATVFWLGGGIILLLLNGHGVNEVRQNKIHMVEPLVPEPSGSEVEMAIEKLKTYKLPGIDKIPAELIQARGKTIHSEIHKLINSVWNKDELPHQRGDHCTYL